MTTTGGVWSSGTPGNLYASSNFYSAITPAVPTSTNAWFGTVAARIGSDIGDLSTIIGTSNAALGQSGLSSWGGELANLGTHIGIFPQDSTGAPSTTALQSICNKTIDYQAFDAAHSITTQSLYRMNDAGEWGDSSVATITGYLSAPSGTSGGTATLNISSTVFGSFPSSGTSFTIAGPGLPWNTSTPAWATVNAATNVVTFPASITSIAVGSIGSPVQFSVGKWKPLVPLSTGLVNGYITASGGSGVCASKPCLNVTSIPTGVGTLGATFTGTYNPALTTNNLTVSGVTGTIQSGMLVTDGGASITGPPLLITSGSGTTWTANGGYYPSTIRADASMVGTLTNVNLNESVMGLGMTTPVQIVGYGTGFGGTGTYVISSSANGAVASSGSPIQFAISSITGGGAVAPGPALTLTDVGAGTMYAVNNYPSSSPTGTIPLKGTYDTVSLGGTPSAIQAQLSATAGGPAISGFSWTNLSSSTISAGSWSGKLTNVPPGIYWVSVRAANGTSFVTMNNFVTVGAVFDVMGLGNAGALFGSSGGSQNTTINGYASGAFSAGAQFVYGPSLNSFRPNNTQSKPLNNYSQAPANQPQTEPTTVFDQTFYNKAGYGAAFLDLTLNGTWDVPSIVGNQAQYQTIGIGDGASTTWCSNAILCANNANGKLAYQAAGLTGATITGTVAASGGSGVCAANSCLTVTAMVAGALEPTLVLSGAGVTGSPTLTACVSGCAYTAAGAGAGSVWLLSSAQSTIGSQSFYLAPFLAARRGQIRTFRGPPSRYRKVRFPLVGRP